MLQSMYPLQEIDSLFVQSNLAIAQLAVVLQLSEASLKPYESAALDTHSA